MTFTAVVTSHGTPGPARILDVLAAQTVPPDQTILYLSGQDPAEHDGADVRLWPNHRDWGHSKRADGLALATGEWVGWFADDDDYRPDYIETMVGHDADLVYCDFDNRGRPTAARLESGRITCGAIVARTELARQVGWNGRTYEADWDFVADMIAAGARTHHVARLLHFHR